MRRTALKGALVWTCLLAVLLFGTGGQLLFARSKPAVAQCAARPTCCCGHSGLAKCACDGHAGPHAQLAALTSCSGESAPQALLTAPLHALLPHAGVGICMPAFIGAAPAASSAVPPFAAPQPSTPPPQAT